MDCDGVQIGSETWELSCGRVKGIQLSFNFFVRL